MGATVPRMEQTKTEHGEPKSTMRGTWRDWPARVLFVGVMFWLYLAVTGGTPTVVVYLWIGFGAIAWMLRAGAFSPRR